jgi:transketolase
MATNYKEKAKDARLTVLDMIYRAQSSHIGSNFSCIDILTVLFDKIDLTKDKVILSAGWKAAAFYYFLADKGYFPKEELLTYNQEGSRLIGLTEPGVPGVDFAGGSMQMGLPAAVGFAIAKKIKGEEGKVYCLMSDGELAGGMFYEACVIAKHHNLENVKFLVDGNRLQAMGEVENILDHSTVLNSENRYNGHDYTFIEIGIDDCDELVTYFTTVKGKGVSFMENNNLYHYKDLSLGEYEKAKAELQNA